ncbi:hypothetical protein RFI_11471, partial [Reticulomyxa filosa]
RLLKQCQTLNISILQELPKDLSSYSLFVDAIFGFSFEPPVRGVWVSIINEVNAVSSKHNIPVVAVDLPSGWDVDKGKLDGKDSIALNPSMIVSLSAPKKCTLSWEGVHYVGGRFLTPDVIEKYQVKLPDYPHTQQVMRIDTIKHSKI